MPNGLWEDLMVVMDPHHDQISVVCKVLGVVAMAVCVVALFAPGVNILAAGALVASLLSPLGHCALAVVGAVVERLLVCRETAKADRYETSAHARYREDLSVSVQQAPEAKLKVRAGAVLRSAI